MRRQRHLGHDHRECVTISRLTKQLYEVLGVLLSGTERGLGSAPTPRNALAGQLCQVPVIPFPIR